MVQTWAGDACTEMRTYFALEFGAVASGVHEKKLLPDLMPQNPNQQKRL